MSGTDEAAGTAARLERASRSASESAPEVGGRQQEADSLDLRVDPAAGEELRAMLEDQLDKVDDWLRRAGDLTRSAPLGQHPVADAMAAKFANRADGSEESFTDVLTRYREVLQQAHDAVSECFRTYDEIDAGVADRIRQLLR